MSDKINNNPSVFPMGEALPAGSFTGGGYLNQMTARMGPVFNVTFEPGSHNGWHIHHKGGQVLLVTGGRGWYQEWGKEPQELHPGDIVDIPPEVKHWHGAAKDSWFSHLAVLEAVPDASTENVGDVSEQDYDNLE